MDGRDVPQGQQQQPSNMVVGHNSYQPSNVPPPMINPNSASMISPSARFPFNSMVPQPQQSLDGPSSAPGGFDGSSLRFNVEPAKKKRGRPRKYTPDGNIALGLSPTPISSVTIARGGGCGDSSAGGGGTPSSDPPAKRKRGRPPGSGKKQLDALGSGGVGFTPHVIMVQAGEDIASKLVAFSQQGPRTVCILSASGTICNVTLRQPAMSRGPVTYEGRYEIISLSGSFLLSDNNSGRTRTGGLNVSLAGSDGRVLGGEVAGMLLAASPVHVIVGSFIADVKNNILGASKSRPSASTPHMLNFGGPVTTASPPSPGASSESSDEHGSSPINRGPGFFHNPGQPPMHNMQMYHLWAGHASQ